MSGHDIIVIGASAGGVEALSQIVRDLPPDLPATICVVLHISPQGTTILPKILNRSLQKRQSSSLVAVHPQDGEQIQQGKDAQQRAALVRQLLLKGENNGKLSTSNREMVGAKDIASAVVRQPTTNSPKQVLSQQTKDTNTYFNMVSLCASAGGLKALSKVLSGLPADFPAAITVVQHLHGEQSSNMADILSGCTALKVKEAESGDVLRPETVYIAPTNKHLLVNPDSTLSLSHSELVHFVRPSADLLFESVAASFKQRVFAVVLTGKGSDGAMGIRAIKEMGGTVIAQDKATSEYFGMPGAAINTGVVDWVVFLDKIAETLVNLVKMKN